LTSKGGKESDALARAIGAVVEGLTFYDLAHAAVAEMRVKVAFEELGRRQRDQLSKLESVAGPNARAAAVMPGIYPIDAVAKLECYVCGFVVETTTIPNQCPKCGAARYAFEKEIALTKAWEIAAETDRKAALLLRDAARHTTGRTKSVLEELVREDEGHAAEADKQLAELRT
jgi:rubrerythrin